MLIIVVITISEAQSTDMAHLVNQDVMWLSATGKYGHIYFSCVSMMLPPDGQFMEG